MTILVSFIATAHAGSPINILPSAYSGEADLEIYNGPQDGWVLGSHRTFSIGPDWETLTSALSHGPDLGFSTTNYNYSTPTNSFRYDFQSGIQSINLFPEGTIDRDFYLSPLRGYELLAQSQDSPTETTPEGLVVYSRMNKAVQTKAYIAIDPSDNTIHWIETRYEDGSSRERYIYSDWKEIDADHSIPTRIEFTPDVIGGIRVTITDFKAIPPDTPPQPKSLSKNYTVYDYATMETFDPQGHSLGKIQFPNQAAKPASRISKRSLFIACGLILIIISGTLLYRRNARTA